jgi:tetratricopeptide (TPR) repeat protein
MIKEKPGMMQNKHLYREVKLFYIFIVILLSVLCCYNSFLIAQEQDILNDTFYKISVLEEIMHLLEKKYVLSNMAKQYADEFKKRYSKGCYDSYTNTKNFAEQITADLISITNDKHINFRVIEASDMGENPQSSLHHPIRYHRLGIKENKGFSKLEWIEGNIGYLDIRRFYGISDIKDVVDAIMKLLSNANAIIIDLRENGGGSGDYLSSYFLEHPTQLNSWYSREDDYVTEFWTSNETGIEPITDVPLFLLTSKRTFSAAESFAYDLKVRKRAVVIGDSTKGGAHSVDLFKIDNHFEIYIPTARAINPVTGENWEGAGVIPDILVPAESAFDTALVLAKKAGAEYGSAKEAKLKLAVEEMQRHMDHTELLFREKKNDKAQAALDSVFQLAYKNGLINEFFIDVLAYNYYSQKDEEILYAILNRKIEFFPKSPTAYETLAYAYYKYNKNEQAIDYFKKILKLDPENGNARRMIKQLKNE